MVDRQPCLHVDPVRPYVDDLTALQATLAPFLELRRPSRPQSPNRRLRQRCPLGSRAPSSFVRLANNGSTRLSNRSSTPRTRGRRSVIVPELIANRLGRVQMV